MVEYASITKSLTFDAGHRIPFHNSKCRNCHGHTWTLEATFFGQVNPVRGKSDDGMLVDFSQMKSIMKEKVVDLWDHGFIVWKEDKVLLTALHLLGPGHKTIVVDSPPTSEYLVMLAYKEICNGIDEYLGKQNRIGVWKTRLYETPTCYAEYEPFRNTLAE